ncbi:hypothetical protein ACXYUI_30255, partial [Klebsiella pneumoniae]
FSLSQAWPALEMFFHRAFQPIATSKQTLSSWLAHWRTRLIDLGFVEIDWLQEHIFAPLETSFAWQTDFATPAAFTLLTQSCQQYC